MKIIVGDATLANVRARALAASLISTSMPVVRHGRSSYEASNPPWSFTTPAGRDFWCPGRLFFYPPNRRARIVVYQCR
jgi:hypothetical protein